MTLEVKNSVKPIDYNQSMKIMERRVQDVLMGRKNEFLWIIEHKSVYTGGSTFETRDIINKNIKVIKTKRGGKITFHGPGQKVVYFVLDLNKRGKDVRKLVRNVELCIINILKEYKLDAYNDKKNIGIWINSKNKVLKIAAIGIKIKKWVAYHGFSINVCNDLKKYDAIIPCGIRGRGITSMKTLGINNYKNINKIIKKNFLNTFL
jgi:lipoyl(octanoyl) transferase